MKIKTCRQSGKPVDLKKIEEFENEFKEKYDAILKVRGKDMLAVQKDLEAVDAELNEKYDTLVMLPLPTTKKAMKAFVKDYGSYLISTHVETGELMLIIMDMGI